MVNFFLILVDCFTRLPGWPFHLPAGVKRFVYISAADFGVANYLLQGYYEGKVPSSDVATCLSVLGSSRCVWELEKCQFMNFIVIGF